MADTRTIVKVLDSIGRDVCRNYKRIDDGGCGVAALEFAKHLRAAGFTVKFKITTAPWERPSLTLTELRRNIIRNKEDPTERWKIWNNVGMDMRHVIATFKINGRRYGLDASNGCHPLKASGRWGDGALVRGFFKDADLEKLVANEHTWNPTFRECHDKQEVIEFIQRRMQEFSQLFG